MNRNTRLLVYLFFGIGLLLVMMDCSRRMQHHKAHAAADQAAP